MRTGTGEPGSWEPGLMGTGIHVNRDSTIQEVLTLISMRSLGGFATQRLALKSGGA